MAKVHIGCGAGFAGDRFDACLPVIAALSGHDGPRYLIFEVLAERTLALAQQIRLHEPDRGYSPYLDQYMSRALA
ncbi:MAG: acyclic terpene utilization AtuA family protein, partial [Pseudomonadota bacterium]